MSNNKVENITAVRTLDNVLQQNTGEWKPVIQAVKNVSGVFILEPYDVGKYIRVTSASDITLIIPNEERFPIGGIISFEQVGAGTITLSAATGVTLNGKVLSSGQYSVIQAIKVDLFTWTVIGGTE